jgi:hypothetical protein
VGQGIFSNGWLGMGGGGGRGMLLTDISQPKLGPQNFDILCVVGQGAFGKIGLECCGVVNLYRLQRQAL